MSKNETDANNEDLFLGNVAVVGDDNGTPIRRGERPRRESEIEVLAQRIEDRRSNRIDVPFVIRKAFIQQCYDISLREGYKDHDRIHLEDLYSMKEQRLEETRYQSLPTFVQSLGFLDHQEVWKKIFDRAEEVIEKSHLREEGWFYYRDFVVRACILPSNMNLRWMMCVMESDLYNTNFSLLVLSYQIGELFTLDTHCDASIALGHICVLHGNGHFLLPHGRGRANMSRRPDRSKSFLLWLDERLVFCEYDHVDRGIRRFGGGKIYTLGNLYWCRLHYNFHDCCRGIFSCRGRNGLSSTQESLGGYRGSCFYQNHALDIGRTASR